jgi:hypothetical protein
VFTDGLLGNSSRTFSVFIDGSTYSILATQLFPIQVPISRSQLALRVFIGPPVGARHLQSVPANSVCDRLAFPDGFLRFEVTLSCLNSRPTASGNKRHRQQVRQLASRHFDKLTWLDAMPWPDPFTAHFHVPTLHCRCCQNPRLEKSCVPQPLIYAL